MNFRAVISRVQHEACLTWFVLQVLALTVVDRGRAVLLNVFLRILKAVWPGAYGMTAYVGAPLV